MHRIKIYFLTLLIAFLFEQSVMAKNTYFAEGEKLFLSYVKLSR